MTDIEMVVAYGENREIGKNGNLPWHYPIDLVHFQRLTESYPCVYGRKTYEQIPFSPPHTGTALVLTTSGTDTNHPTVIECKDIQQTITTINCLPTQRVFICGGESIYRQFLEYADTLHISEIPESVPNATSYFPEYNEKNWSLDSEQTYNNITFKRLTKRSE